LEHNEMLGSIVEAERSAREITRKAEEQRHSLDKKVEIEIEACRKTYQQEAERRLAVVRNAEEKQLEQSLRELDARAKAALEDIDRKDRQNHDQWVESLVRRIIEE